MIADNTVGNDGIQTIYSESESGVTEKLIESSERNLETAAFPTQGSSKISLSSKLLLTSADDESKDVLLPFIP